MSKAPFQQMAAASQANVTAQGNVGLSFTPPGQLVPPAGIVGTLAAQQALHNTATQYRLSNAIGAQDNDITRSLDYLLDLFKTILTVDGQIAAHNALQACIKHVNNRRHNWSNPMRTYQLGLRMDFADKARHDELIKLMRQSAKLLFTQASLLSDGRTPEVSLACEDFFEGTSELEVVTNEDEQP
jgi:hypothetical protein